ncbi:MAG: family 78 glycoside hydrolase catalytic domain [Bacteroidales bacterium]|nr:family 78 glycoside hydrolase catalytic domain [Bacteroidales bacterium]
MKLNEFLLCFALAAASVACTGPFGVYDLECEGMTEPLGIDSAEPHFSWKIRSSEPMEQFAYEIQVSSSESGLKSGKADLWATGMTVSGDQVMVPYSGTTLTSRQQCWWRVRVWKNDKEASKWSSPQRFGVGVVGDDSLDGEYIGAVPGEGRSPILRKVFDVDRKAGQAILYVNSLGYHEAYLNGTKVSEGVLNPAVSQLDKRSLIVTYDVTGLLKKGSNEIVLWTSSGWYKPVTFNAKYEGPLVKAELDIFTPEGIVPVVCTDASWLGAWSGYMDYDTWYSGRFGGETIDARVVPSGLDKTALDKLEWEPVDVVGIDGIAATPQMCPPCVVQETVTAVSVEPYGNTGGWLVDFGRVMNGMLDIVLPSLPEGHRSTATFSDNLNPDGTIDPVSRNYYISSGAAGGDRFVNKFNHHVFRYVLLDSLDTAPKAEDVKGMRMRTDYSRSSSFKSSDKEIDSIHDMVAYTLENLAFDGYMVDCANIERLGYGGDGNASALTFQTMFDASPLYINWLQAWNDVIQEDGGLPHTAPSPCRAGGGPYWCGFIVQAPWRTYMSYGDSRLLERCYPTMRHWLDYVDAYTVDGLLKRWPDNEYRSWYLGDWAAPDGVDVTDPESVDLVNNCSLCQVYRELEAIAALVGHPEDASEYRSRYDALAKRINEVLYHQEECIYGSGSQIDMVYPMLVGIVQESDLEKVREKLFERTATVYEGHLKTGLVGVPVIAEWATLSGECDWMYGMLKQHGYPGYLYMLDNGATGTWEHWNAERSRLHNCFNGIGSWFYQALGGIIPDAPGYRHIILDPQIPEGLDKVEVVKGTPYGDIVVKRDGRKLHFELPVGVTATFKGDEYSCGSYDREL